MNRNVLFAGFMLFSLFFGAGNLIFPPYLGMEAGDAFTPAIIGFLTTAVLLPLFAVVAISLSDEKGLISIGSRVTPLFGLVFSIVIYMSIGPFYGIPRAASVGYELGFAQVFHLDHPIALFIFTLVFFGIAFIISVRPKKIIDNVGKILTPALLIVLTILFVRAYYVYQTGAASVAEKYQDAPFLTGFLEGYFTMDAIAALAFGIVIVNALSEKGAATRQSIIRGTFGAGIIAAIGLSIVYLSLGWIGRVLPETLSFNNGAEILTFASNQLFGFSGSVLFGLIVLLACLTTVVGLITATSQFFESIAPKFSYNTYAVVFTIIGIFFTNFGLDTILAVAAPLLVFVYPAAIVLVLLSLAQYFIGESRLMYVFSVPVAVLFGLYDAANALGWVSPQVANSFSFIPLFDNGLGWVVPVLILAIIGYVIDHLQGRVSHVS